MLDGRLSRKSELGGLRHAQLTSVTVRMHHPLQDKTVRPIGSACLLRLLVALAAPLVLVWWFPYFPTIDGPAHVHVSHAIRHVLAGDPVYADFFQFNEHITPNLLTEWALLGLMFLVSPLVAEKVLLTLYFGGLALAGFYAVRAVQPHAAPLSLLVLFCGFSYSFVFGFYNFSISAILLLAWLAFWWRHREHGGWKVAAGHVGFAVACYFTHLFALAVSLMAIGAVGIGVMVRDWVRREPDGPQTLRWWGRFLRTHVLPPAIGSLPALLGGVLFLYQRMGGQVDLVGDIGELGYLEIGLWVRLVGLVSAAALAPYHWYEIVATSAFAVLLFVMVFGFARRGGRFVEAIPFGVAAGIFLLAYFISVGLFQHAHRARGALDAVAVPAVRAHHVHPLAGGAAAKGLPGPEGAGRRPGADAGRIGGALCGVCPHQQ